MASRVALSEIRSRTYKQRDAWWTVWLVDPLASRLVWLVSPWRWITPNVLTFAAFLVGLGAAASFWTARDGGYRWLLLGAVLFHLSFVLDCMDGKIARLNGTGSVFGAWLDYVFDRLRVASCAIAMFGGQYDRTHDFAYVWLGGLVLFLDMFRYLNALQMGKVKTEMRANLEALAGPVEPSPSVDDVTPAEDVEFRARHGRFVTVRNALMGRRIRPHVFSGIEFMMFVFILGPLLNWIIGMTLLSAALMVVFELLLIYKLWTATRAYTRKMAAAPPVPAQPVTDEVTAGVP